MMQQQQHVLQMDKILLFGDSLTQRSFQPDRLGWGGQLANLFVRKLDVVNRGFSGYNSTWCKEILPAILAAEIGLQPLQPPQQEQKLQLNPKIQLVTILLGSNDAGLPHLCPHQHVPVATYAANLDAMVRCIHSTSPLTRIVLITPPPVHERKWQLDRSSKGLFLDRTLAHVRLYRDACIGVAQAHPHVALLDLWAVFLGTDTTSNANVDPEATEQAEPDRLQSHASSIPDSILEPLFDDGLHFDQAGNSQLFSALVKAVLAKWPELDPYPMTPLLPYHDQIDSACPNLFRSI